MRKSFAVLRHRDFRLLVLGQAVSVLGDSLVPLSLTFAVLDDLHGSATDVGLVLAAQTAALGAFVLAGGVWADRLPRRLLMLTSDTGRAVVQACIAALLLSGHASVASLATLIAVFGALEALFRPAIGGLVPQLVPREEIQQANALLGLCYTGGFVLGPAIAGVLIAVSGPGTAFVVDSATFVVSVAFLMRMRVPARVIAPGDADRAGAHFLADFRGGLHEAWSRPWLRRGLGVMLAYHFIALPCVLGLGPVLAAREYGGAASWAVITSCFGLGTAVGTTLALRLQPRRPLFTSFLAFAAASLQSLVIATAGSVAAIAACEAVLGVAVAWAFTVWESTLGREIPEHAISRITSLDWFVSVGVAMPAGYALAGPIADAAGLRPTMIAAALISASVALLSLQGGQV